MKAIDRYIILFSSLLLAQRWPLFFIFWISRVLPFCCTYNNNTVRVVRSLGRGLVQPRTLIIIFDTIDRCILPGFTGRIELKECQEKKQKTNQIQQKKLWFCGFLLLFNRNANNRMLYIRNALAHTHTYTHVYYIIIIIIVSYCIEIY